MTIRLLRKTVKHAMLPLLNKAVTRNGLARHLRSLGVAEGGLLLAHASLSRFGYVNGGAATVIEALRDTIGPQGTLAFPAHTWEWMNRGLRVFDARSTPGCVGQISEVFRQRPGVVRSLHPTHSIAAEGPRAAEWCAGHEQCAAPCDDRSPYMKVLEPGGQILFLGVDLGCNTAYYVIEWLCGFPHLLRPGMEEFEMIDQQGRSWKQSFAQHLEHVDRLFAEMETPLREAGALRTSHLGGTPILLLDGPRFLATMRAMGEADPLCLMKDRTQVLPG